MMVVSGTMYALGYVRVDVYFSRISLWIVDLGPRGLYGNYQSKNKEGSFGR